MCEFVIQGEPHREMAGAIISREEPVGRHSHKQTHTYTFFYKDTEELWHKTKLQRKQIGG